MTIIEKIQEFFSPALVKVGDVKCNRDGSASVMVYYWDWKRDKEKTFYDGRTFLDDTGYTKAMEYRRKMIYKMHNQKRAYLK